MIDMHAHWRPAELIDALRARTKEPRIVRNQDGVEVLKSRIGEEPVSKAFDDVESPIDRARETQEITKPSTATQMIDYSLLDKVLAKIEISLRNNDRMRTHDC